MLRNVTFLIDSGSSSSISDKSTFKMVQKRTQIFSYKSERHVCVLLEVKPPYQLLVNLTLPLNHQPDYTAATITIVKNIRDCLLSGTTSIELGFLHFTAHNVEDQPEVKLTLRMIHKFQQVDSPLSKNMIHEWDNYLISK